MKDLNIASAIMRKRKEKGITQEELAAYMGVSKASVSKWETGQSYPDITFLPQLATYFSISIDELVGYEPQMVKEDIRKLYHRLSEEFAEKPFEEVLEECKGIIKKYYSCFPLLMQMCILLLNHCSLEKEEGKQREILQEIVMLCSRIKQEGNDLWLAKQANSVEAIAQTSLQNPEKVFALLDTSAKPIINDAQLLAGAYQMTGEIPKAKKILQISLYQDIIGYMGAISSYLLLHSQEEDRYEEIIRRTNEVVKTFAIEQLHPGVMLTYYITSAYGYVLLGKEKKALEMLDRYKDLCLSGIFPFTLHGDNFFHLIDDWFADFDLGNKGPRGDKTVKESMILAVTDNPSFASLSNNSEFKRIINTLKQLKFR